MQYPFLPVMNSPVWKLFKSMPPGMQVRGEFLDPDHPELFNPSEVLAAMNIESALCIARTSDMNLSIFFIFFRYS